MPTQTVFVTVDDLKQDIGSEIWTNAEAEGLAKVVTATNDYLRRVRPDVDTPTGDIHLGAIMLARGWLEVGARGSASGFAELGYTPSTITRDVARLLGIDQHNKIAIG